jgi:hypothetical protein
VYKASLLFLFFLASTNYASADVVYNFEGDCDGGCTGTATGVLTLEDTYTPGTPLQDADFISFSYQSTSGSFTIDDTTFFEFQLIAGEPNRGILPAISGPALSYIGLDGIGSGTSLQACPLDGLPANPCNNEGNSSNRWSVEWGPAGISQDYGTPHTWTLQIQAIDAMVDIDPKSNERECRNQEQVVIFGQADFDVTTININTLEFADVNGANGRVPNCRTRYVNEDELLDLVCKFIPGYGEATLTGELDDGTAFEGSDSICAAQ